MFLQTGNSVPMTEALAQAAPGPSLAMNETRGKRQSGRAQKRRRGGPLVGAQQGGGSGGGPQAGAESRAAGCAGQVLGLLCLQNSGVQGGSSMEHPFRPATSQHGLSHASVTFPNKESAAWGLPMASPCTSPGSQPDHDLTLCCWGSWGPFLPGCHLLPHEVLALLGQTPPAGPPRQGRSAPAMHLS